MSMPTEVAPRSVKLVMDRSLEETRSFRPARSAGVWMGLMDRMSLAP